MSRTANPYRIAIPSRRRAQTLRKKTLTMLADTGAHPALIDIFVSDEEDREEYARTLDSQSYATIYVAQPGMRDVRHFIRRHYAHGQHLVCVDDDVSRVKVRLDDKKMFDVDNFADVVTTGFNAMRQVGAKLWGIYPVANPLFMKGSITFDLRYIVGAFWGMENSHDENRFTKLHDKEDYERTLMHYVLDGAVARVNYYAPITAYYTEPGGMQIDRTKARVTDSALQLIKRYPMLCKLNTSKKSGHVELRLRDRRKLASTR